MSALAWLRDRPLWQVVAGAAVLAVSGAFLVYAGTAYRLTLVEKGTERTIFTHASTVGGALRGAGVQLAAEDLVQPAADTSLRGLDRIEYRRAKAVLVQSPDEAQWVMTAAVSPADILAAAGVRLYPADRLWADGIPVTSSTSPLEHVPDRLRLERGRSLTLSQPAGTTVMHSSASTLGEALIEAGYDLRQGDSIVPQAGTPLAALASAEYLAARPIHIAVDGIELGAMASGPTIGEALAQAGIALVGLDRSEPAASEALPSSGEVTVTRVREDVLVEQIPIPPTYGEPQYSNELELDTQEVIDPGAYGVQAKRTRVRYEDGVEVSRVFEGEWQAIQPKPRVVAYGTKIVLKTLDTGDGAIQYYRAITVYATSYSPCRSGTSNCLYYTSSRKPVQRGVIAVRYAWYLALGFGVPVYIPGYGTATIEDIGGGFPDRYWIDLGYSDEDWVTWGSYVTLYFIAPVPPDVPVIFP